MTLEETVIDNQRRIVALEHVVTASIRMLAQTALGSEARVALAEVLRDLASTNRQALWPGSGPMDVEMLAAYNSAVRKHELRLIEIIAAGSEAAPAAG